MSNNQSDTNQQSKANKTMKNSHIQSETISQISNKTFPLKLKAKQLKRMTDPSSLPKSTKKAGDLDVAFGQQRAVKAIKTALGIKANGYHIFAAGENGLGKRTLITRLLSNYSKNMPTPPDSIYVYNFDNPREPLFLQMPAGKGFELSKEVEKIWQLVRKSLVKRFRSDQYQVQIESIKNDIHAKETEAYEKLSEEAKKYNLELEFRSTDNKPHFVEIKEDNEFSDDSENLTKKVNSKANKNIFSKSNDTNKNYMTKRFNKLTFVLESLEEEANQAIEDLNRNIAKTVVDPIFKKVCNKFKNTIAIDYLKTIQLDMVNNVEKIVNQDDDDFIVRNLANVPVRYCVNVISSHKPNSGAPIIFEDLPTHLNLLGHVEQVTHLGTVTTDVSMIRGGSLHHANGGFLLLEASNLLEHPYAWQGLKRALQSKQIKLSSLEQMMTLTGSLSLAPAPIDLDVKVILLGEADVYYDLIEFEPEFDAVFKVRADFHYDIKRNTESEQAMVDKIADIVKDKGLLPFNNLAQASIIDHLSLLADSQDKLSLHSDRLSQILFESNRHATLSNAKQVSKKHVLIAIQDMNERSSYLRDIYWQEIENGQQIINTRGGKIGEINALIVISYADSEFGLPARLTALIQPKIGHGEILDIERDVNLGGSLHAKGMLIQTSYLRSLFSQFYELNFSASLAFEQNYAHIDGDSATLAEACALLSALAQVPINQSIAITGSMNQLGEVQPVGGLNAKISGFYDTCVEQGLTADINGNAQGVIIPYSNINNLMLRDDIIESVNKGKFVIYAIKHLNEALGLLTGIRVDDKTKKGEYRKDSLFGKIANHLKLWEDEDEEVKEEK